MTDKRWRVIILVESDSKFDPDEFHLRFRRFTDAIAGTDAIAVFQGSTGVLRTDPDIYRAEILINCPDSQQANVEATRLIRLATSAADMPSSWARSINVYEWPEGLPLV